MKQCGVCGNWKEKSEFGPKQGNCKPCTKVLYKNRGYDHASMSREWRKKNSERAKEYRRQYLQDNMRYFIDRNHARRRDAGFPSKRTRGLMPLIREQPCFYCKRPGGTIDHIVPLEKGGANEFWNMLPSCRSCNSSKGTKDLIEWLEETGRWMRPSQTSHSTIH